MLTPIILIQSVTLFFLLLCSALISGAEVAFFSISATQLDSIQDNYPKGKELIEKLLKKPKRLSELNGLLIRLFKENKLVGISL